MRGIVTGIASEVPRTAPLVPWWSFTKPALAGAALTLVARGSLALDEAVTGAPYTLRQLLQHRSGLPDYGGVAAYHAAVAARERPWPRALLLERARADVLRTPPGTAFLYSNIGYLFVREMIERTTGLTLNEALRLLLFAPLGIDGVFVATSPEDFARTLWGNAQRYDPNWVYHGLLIGSPDAAASFLHRLLHGPHLPQALKEQMLDPIAVSGPIVGRPFVRPSYGLGLMIDPANALGRVAGHSGAGPGSRAAVYSVLDRPEPVTLAAFVDRDDAAAEGALETDLLTRAQALST